MVYRSFGRRVVILAKRACYQSADKKMLCLPVLTQADTQIALVIRKGGQYSFVPVFQALYTALIADKIFSLVAVNLSPFLAGQVRCCFYFCSPPSYAKHACVFRFGGK